ncbi:MAG: hypothetical protein Q9162_002014 [Coniocarpon cinnabarinum]
MALVNAKQGQTLLLILQARFGSSTLQNYDAVLRDDKFVSGSTMSVRLTLSLLFIIPLALSAGYKRFIDGSTTVRSPNDKPIIFGPTGPPGLFQAYGRALLVNTSSPLMKDWRVVSASGFPDNTSLGYNMNIINDTTTAMLDMPFVDNMIDLQSNISREILTVTAPVNATFARLNSTPTSPERNDEDYWDNVANRFGNGENSIFPNPAGNDTWFDMWSGWVDSSLIYMSYYNTSRNETREDTAYGFNIYRGTARGTWQISSDSIILKNASDFSTDFSPDTVHPEIQDYQNCDFSRATDFNQKIIYCVWNSIAADFISITPQYLLGPNFPDVGRTFNAPLSIWVAITAAMGWANTVTKMYPVQGVVSQQFKYLQYSAPCDLLVTHTTLHRNWGLYAIVAVQPVLLLLILLVRWFLRSTPMPPKFGLIALLAGVDRGSLDLVAGASYSGRVARPVTVRMTGLKHEGGEVLDSASDVSERAICYVLCDEGPTPRRNPTFRDQAWYGLQSYKRLDDD